MNFKKFQILACGLAVCAFVSCGSDKKSSSDSDDSKKTEDTAKKDSANDTNKNAAAGEEVTQVVTIDDQIAEAKALFNDGKLTESAAIISSIESQLTDAQKADILSWQSSSNTTTSSDDNNGGDDNDGNQGYNFNGGEDPYAGMNEGFPGDGNTDYEFGTEDVEDFQ